MGNTAAGEPVVVDYPVYLSFVSEYEEKHKHSVDSGELSPAEAFVRFKRDVVARDYAILARGDGTKIMMSNVINLLRGDVGVNDDDEEIEEEEEEPRVEEEIKIPVEYEDFGIPADTLREWSVEAQAGFQDRAEYKQELILKVVKERMYALVKAVKLQSWARMLPQRRKLLRHIQKKNVQKSKFFVAWRQLTAAEHKYLCHVMGGPFWAWKDDVQDGKRLKMLVREFFNSCIKNLRLTPQAVMAFFAPEEWGNVLADHDKAKIRRLIFVKLFMGWKRESKFLAANRFKAGQLLSRMMRRTKGPLWVKEVNLVCFHMWKRYCGVQRAYRNEEPEPRYQTPFLPQWTKLLSLLTLKRIKKKRSQERGMSLTQLRQWNKWRYMMTVDRSKSLTPQAIAENHHRKKTLVKVYWALYHCIRERGGIARVQHRCFSRWKRYAPLQSRMRKCKAAVAAWDGLCIQKKAFQAMQGLCFDLIGTHATTLKVLRDNLFNRKVLVCAYALLRRDVNVIFLECWRRMQLWWGSRVRWKALKWQYRALWYQNRARNIMNVWRQYAIARALNREAGNEDSDDDDKVSVVARKQRVGSALGGSIGGDADSMCSQTDQLSLVSDTLGRSRMNSLDDGFSGDAVSVGALSITSLGGTTMSHFIPLPPVLEGMASSTYDMVKNLRAEALRRRPSTLAFHVQCMAASRTQAEKRRQREEDAEDDEDALARPLDPSDVQRFLQRQVDNLDFDGVLTAIAKGAVVEPHHVQQVYKYIGENNLPLFNLLAANSPAYFIERVVQGDRAREILNIADPIKAMVISSQSQRWEKGKLSTRELSLIDHFWGSEEQVYGWSGSLLLVRSVALMLFKRKIDLLARSCRSLKPTHTQQEEVEEIMKRKRLDQVYAAAKGVMLMMGVVDADLSTPPAPPPLFQTTEVKHARQVDSWVRGHDIYSLLAEYSDMTGRFSSEAKALRDPLVDRDDRLIRNGFLRYARNEFLALRRLCMTEEERVSEKEAAAVAVTPRKPKKKKPKKKGKKSKKTKDTADGLGVAASRPSTAPGEGEADGQDEGDIALLNPEEEEEEGGPGVLFVVDDGEPYPVLNPEWGDKEVADEREFHERFGGAVGSGDSKCFYESFVAVRSPQWVTNSTIEIAKERLRSSALNVSWRVFRFFLKSSDLFIETPSRNYVEHLAGIGSWMVLTAISNPPILRSIMQCSGLPRSWWNPPRILDMASQEDAYVEEKVKATEQTIVDVVTRQAEISKKRKTYTKFINDTRSQVLAIAKKKADKLEDDAIQRNVKLRAVGPLQKDIAAINARIDSIKTAIVKTQFLFAGSNYQGVYEAFGLEFTEDLAGIDNSVLNIECMHLVERKRQEIVDLQARVAEVEEKIGHNDHEVQYFDKLCERSTTWLQSLAKGRFDEMIEVQRMVKEGSDELDRLEVALEESKRVTDVLRCYHEKLRNFIKALRKYLGVDVDVGLEAVGTLPEPSPVVGDSAIALDEAYFYDSSRPMTAIRSRPGSPSDLLTMEFSSTLLTPSMSAPEPRVISEAEVAESMLLPIKPVTPFNMKSRKEEMLRAEREAEAARAEAARLQQLAEMLERTKQEYWNSIIPPALKKAKPSTETGDLLVVGTGVAMGDDVNVLSGASVTSDLSSTQSTRKPDGGKTTKMWEKTVKRKVRDKSRRKGDSDDFSDEEVSHSCAPHCAPFRQHPLSGFEDTSKGVWEVDMYVTQPSVSMRPQEDSKAAPQRRLSSSKRAKEAPQDPFVLAGKASMLQVKEAVRRMEAKADGGDDLASAISRTINANKSDAEAAAAAAASRRGAEVNDNIADDDTAKSGTADDDDMTIITAEQEEDGNLSRTGDGSAKSVKFADDDDLHTQTVVELADYPQSPNPRETGGSTSPMTPPPGLSVPQLIYYDNDGDDISMVSMEERPLLDTLTTVQPAHDMTSEELRELEMQLRHSLSIGSDVDDSVILAPTSCDSSVGASIIQKDEISLPDALSFVSISRGTRRSFVEGRESPEQQPAEVLAEASLKSIFSARTPSPKAKDSPLAGAALSSFPKEVIADFTLKQRLGLGLGGQLEDGSFDGSIEAGPMAEGSLVEMIVRGLNVFAQEREASLAEFSRRLQESNEEEEDDQNGDDPFPAFAEAALALSGESSPPPNPSLVPLDDELDSSLSPQRLSSQSLNVVTENLLILKQDAQDRPSYSSMMAPQDRASFVRALYSTRRKKMKYPPDPSPNHNLRVTAENIARSVGSVDGSSVVIGGSGFAEGGSIIPEDLMKKRPKRPSVKKTEQQLRADKEREHKRNQSLMLAGLQYIPQDDELDTKRAAASAAAASRDQLLKDVFDDYDEDSNLRRAYEIVFGSCLYEEDGAGVISYGGFDDEDETAASVPPPESSLQQKRQHQHQQHSSSLRNRTIDSHGTTGLSIDSRQASTRVAGASSESDGVPSSSSADASALRAKAAIYRSSEQAPQPSSQQPFNHVPTGTKMKGVSVSKKEFLRQQQLGRSLDENALAVCGDSQATEDNILADLRQFVAQLDSPRSTPIQAGGHEGKSLSLSLSDGASGGSYSMMDDMDERSIESQMRHSWQQKKLKQSRVLSNAQALDRYIAFGLTKQQTQSTARLPPLKGANEASTLVGMSYPIDVFRVILGGGIASKKRGKMGKPNPRLAGLFSTVTPSALTPGEAFELSGSGLGGMRLSMSVSELPSNTTSYRLLKTNKATELALSFDYGEAAAASSSVTDEESIISAPRVEIISKKGRKRAQRT